MVRVFMKINDSGLYIALEKYDFDWTNDKVEKFLSMCEQRKTINQLATIFRRHPIECLCLYVDLLDQEKFEPYMMIHETIK